MKRDSLRAIAIGGLVFGSVYSLSTTAEASQQFAAPVDQAAPGAMTVYEAQLTSFDWDRCYVGGHAAYGWGNNKNSFGTALESDPTEGEGLPGEAGPYNHTTKGGGLGVQAGCLWGGPWVWGFEGEFMWSGIKGRKTTPEDFVPPGDPGDFSRFASSNRWDGDIALRFGHTWPKDLLYGKIGAVFGDFRYRETHDDFPTTHSCPGGSGTCSVNFSKTRAGLQLGVGWEHAWGSNWTTKVEYDYDNFGSTNIPYPDLAATIKSFKVRDTKNIIQVGVNIYFP